MNIPRIATFLTAALLLSTLSIAPSQAWWFHKKPSPKDEAAKKVQTYQPPPEEAMSLYCEPYRKESVRLSTKPWILKPFYGPRRIWLMNQFNKCRNNLMTQEHEYLKHVDIQLPPSLPKIKPVVEPINQPETKHVGP